MKHFFKALAGIMSAAILATMSGVAYFSSSLADSYTVEKGEPLAVQFPFIQSEVKQSDDIPASQSDIKYKQVDLSLFGIIPIKEANLTEMNRVSLIPCGTPFGIKILTEGVIVVGLNEIDTQNGNVNPAKDSGIQVGDLIHAINGKDVTSNQDIAALVSASGGEPLTIRYTRNGKENTALLQPAWSKSDQKYKAGLWVRDSSAGIGTITYCDASGRLFGGLGHPVCDVDTGMILPLAQGEIVGANISGAKKGKVGSPGELIGSFTTDQAIGTLNSNTESGVFGSLNQPLCNHSALPIAFKQEIHTGKATIYTTIKNNQPEEYQVEIESVNPDDKTNYKNMIVRITDERLLQETGGIVQGMSGSPIMQDGKIIGAVTHVFVNDPTKGYGIFIENMLQASQTNIPLKSAA